LFDFYQTQRYGDAALYLQGIYGYDPDDFKALNQLAYCYYMAGDYVQSEKFYYKAYQQQPQNLPILFSLASINGKRGNTEKAKLFYTEIIKIDSNNFNVYKQLANLFQLPTDSLKMIYLNKANKINSAEGDVAIDLANAYSKLKNNEKAYSILNTAILADTDNLILQKAKLPIANQLHKYSEVIYIGEKLLQNGTDAAVLKDVASAYYYSKKYQKTIALFNQLEKMAMQNESTLYYTAISYRHLKNDDMATAYAKKTIEEGISENTSDYYLLLGLIYQENNQLNSSNLAYKKGLQFKKNAVLYYRLAVLYDTKLVQPKNALIYYMLYLKNKPDAKQYQEEIEYAKNRIIYLKKPSV